MKNLLVLFIFALVSVLSNINAQSLATQTGEQTSLYNAICIANDITPGDITMTKFRELAKEYAISIGLNYQLFKFNGEQNLEILHATPKTYTNSSTSTPSSSNDVVSTPMTITETVIVNEISSSIDTAKVTLLMPYSNVATISTLEIACEEEEKEVVEPIQVAFCDCEGKTKEELNQYYTERLWLRRNTPKGKIKDQHGLCAYQIRKYLQTDVKKANKKTKRKRTKLRGNGLSRSNRGFFQKLFPFANC
jgi:hypothetical protein